MKMVKVKSPSEIKLQGIKADAEFAVHAFNDPAWVRHYEGDLARVIGDLR